MFSDQLRYDLALGISNLAMLTVLKHARVSERPPKGEFNAESEVVEGLGHMRTKAELADQNQATTSRAMGFGKRNKPLEGLQGLASAKGYFVSKATMAGCYYLTHGQTDRRVLNVYGTPAFSIHQAMQFLRMLPDPPSADTLGS